MHRLVVGLRPVAFVVALAAALLVTSAVEAQVATSRPAPRLQWSLSGGAATLPGFRDRLMAPWGQYVEGNVRTPLLGDWLGLRTGARVAWGDGHSVSAIQELMLTPLPTRWSPYLLGGGLITRAPAQEVAGGWTAGAGLNVPIRSRTLFLEWRASSVYGTSSVSRGVPERRWLYQATLGAGLRF